MPDESSEASEQVAVERVRAGDRDAYAVLVRLHASSAHRAAVLFGAGPDAEDVVQTAFVKAYEALPRFRNGAPFRPWLLRIVQNEAKNAARAAARRDGAIKRYALRDGPPADASDPVATLLSDERQRELLAAVHALPEPLQRAIVCRFLLDLSEQETATVLGCRAGTVKSRVHRALRRLREQLPEPMREAGNER
ncbi:MAG TPA: sigma-70 family RNA polymerase sigma factor [Jiangellaceae bacterium]